MLRPDWLIAGRLYGHGLRGKVFDQNCLFTSFSARVRSAALRRGDGRDTPHRSLHHPDKPVPASGEYGHWCAGKEHAYPDRWGERVLETSHVPPLRLGYRMRAANRLYSRMSGKAHSNEFWTSYSATGTGTECITRTPLTLQRMRFELETRPSQRYNRGPARLGNLTAAYRVLCWFLDRGLCATRRLGRFLPDEFGLSPWFSREMSAFDLVAGATIHRGTPVAEIATRITKLELSQGKAPVFQIVNVLPSVA